MTVVARLAVLAMIASVLVGGCSECEPEGDSPASSPAERPNVIVVLSDQHRWQAMSFSETPDVLTPTLEQLAQDGFSASHMVSNYPLCSPARAIALTGRWPWQTGVIDNATRDYAALSTEEVTLGTIFQRAGYETAYVGKWHLGGEDRDLSEYGFEHSIVWVRTNDHWNSRYFRKAGERIQSDRYNGTHMTDQFLEILERPRDRPFFGILSWNLPHSSYIDPPKEIRRIYAQTKKPPWRENWSLPPDTPIEWVGGGHYRGYHAHVTAIDGELQRVLSALEEQGLERDTVVVYVSDHGAMLRSQGLLGKRVPFAESIRVPFLVRWPGVVPAGGTTDAPLGLIDFVPTLGGLVGVPVPDGLPGDDLSDAILGREGPLPESQYLMNVAVSHRPEDQPGPDAPLYRGVTTSRYTYAVDEQGPWLLFDDERDPLQMQNLVNDPAHTALRERMNALLRDWVVRTGDDFPLPDS